MMINLVSFMSERQLVSECLDILLIILREFFLHYQQSQIDKPSSQLNSLSVLQEKQKRIENGDLSVSISFFLENYDNIIEYLKLTNQNQVRNYLFEIRNTRNEWAHNKVFDVRSAYRVYDTVQLLLTELNVNKESVQYAKINNVREVLAYKMSQEMILNHSDIQYSIQHGLPNQQNWSQGIQQPQHQLEVHQQYQHGNQHQYTGQNQINQNLSNGTYQ